MDPQLDSNENQTPYPQQAPVQNTPFVFNKRVIFLGVILLIILLIFIIASLLLIRSYVQNSVILSMPTPTPVRSSNQNPGGSTLSTFTKTSIGETTESELRKFTEVLDEESLDDNTKKITFKSVNVVYPDEAILENNKVVFEKTSTQTDKQGGYPKLSSYLQTYGEAERVIKGNARYQQVTLSSYLYPAKGFVLIANPTTGLVYEVQRFVPTTIEDYLSRYGDYVEGLEVQRT